MTLLKRLWNFLFTYEIIPWRTNPPVKEITPTEAYAAGFANGSACGELRGRNAAITELEVILASKAKTEFEAEDVATVKYRTIH